MSFDLVNAFVVAFCAVDRLTALGKFFSFQAFATLFAFEAFGMEGGTVGPDEEQIIADGQLADGAFVKTVLTEG